MHSVSCAFSETEIKSDKHLSVMHSVHLFLCIVLLVLFKAKDRINQIIEGRQKLRGGDENGRKRNEDQTRCRGSSR